MKYMKTFSCLLIYVFLFTGAAKAASWYIDNAVRASGNGTSWTAAWKNFSDIKWEKINPGDTIYISGGATSRTYYETLSPTKSGTRGHPIIITRAIDPGRNGIVIIDSQYSRYWAVHVDRYDYVTIHGLKAMNSTESNFRVEWSKGIIVQNNVVYTGSPNKGGNARAFTVRNSIDTIVRYNSCTTPPYTTDQTDCAFSTGDNNVYFVSNTWIVSNAGENHNDCISSYYDNNIFIIGNYCEQRNNRTYNALGIFARNVATGKTVTVYNNIVNSPNSQDSGITMYNDDNAFRGRMVAYNNTAYGGPWGAAQIGNSPSSVFKNNVLYSPNGVAFKITGALPPPANIDYNLLYGPKSSAAAFIESTGFFTWSEWRARGYEAHGMNADPKLGARFTLQPGSPGIDRGVRIASVATDYLGVHRPQGAGFDIGAYERK